MKIVDIVAHFAPSEQGGLENSTPTANSLCAPPCARFAAKTLKNEAPLKSP